MESDNIRAFITEMVETFLPRFSKISLVMRIQFNWSHYTKEDQISFKKDYLLVFDRPSNYTKVFLKELNENLIYSKPQEMELMSNHDSCWRSDGLRWIFKTYSDAWDYFESKGIEGREIHPMIRFGLFGGNPKYWKIEYKIKDYKAIVKFKESVSLKEAYQYLGE